MEIQRYYHLKNKINEITINNMGSQYNNKSMKMMEWRANKSKNDAVYIAQCKSNVINYK